MLNLDCTILSQVVDQAMRDAAGHPRWLNAINRAVVEVLSNPYMHRDADHGGLILVSSSSGELYTSNGTCQCEAYTYGKPCWHRAAARLVRLHDERQAKIAAPFVCGACKTSDYGPSAMQPAICYECVNAWLHGFSSRIEQTEAKAAIDADVYARQAAAEAALDECY